MVSRKSGITREYANRGKIEMSVRRSYTIEEDDTGYLSDLEV
jgi:hypothetical protein